MAIVSPHQITYHFIAQSHDMGLVNGTRCSKSLEKAVALSLAIIQTRPIRVSEVKLSFSARYQASSFLEEDGRSSDE